LKDDKVVYVPPEPKNITLDSPIPDKNETFVRKILWNILKGIFITCMFLFCYSMYLWNKEENQYNDELNNMTDIYARNYCKQEHLEYDKFGTVIYGKNDSNRTNLKIFRILMVYEIFQIIIALYLYLIMNVLIFH
jgi:magnesium-transporting ATPase (P-type)